METLSSSPKKSTLLLGILILLAILFSLTIFGGKALLSIYHATDINAQVLTASRILFWGALLLIFVYARKVEKQKLLIWQERKYQLWQYLISVIAIFFALIIGLLIIVSILLQFGFQNESEKFVQLLLIFRAHPFLIFLTALTAGAVEELTFRGYMIPRLSILLKNPALAIFISSVLFGLLHFTYGTVIQVVGPFFIGLIFAIYYYKFRNIKVLIFCHFLWDVMAIYLQLLADDIKNGRI
jgi:membrane protease YdiL (CAAX protease family)